MTDTPRSPRAPRPQRLGLTLAAPAVPSPSVPSAAAPKGEGRAPDLCDCTKPTVAGANGVAFPAYAEGVQIHRRDGTSWNLVAPDAVPSADAGGHGVVGVHHGGPTREAVDGSLVVGTVLGRRTADHAPIPCLLLCPASRGPGISRGISSIRRVGTTGGKAPAYSGRHAGEPAEVPCTAEHDFHRAPHR